MNPRHPAGGPHICMGPRRFHSHTPVGVWEWNFKKYQIYGVKALDYLDWCKVAELMQNKVHLTKEGIDEIKKIKSRMNTGRKF